MKHVHGFTVQPYVTTEGVITFDSRTICGRSTSYHEVSHKSQKVTCSICRRWLDNPINKGKPRFRR